LRVVSVAILILALYSIHRRITRSCTINYKVPSNKDSTNSRHHNNRNRIDF
jgi:hypothetical protein